MIDDPIASNPVPAFDANRANIAFHRLLADQYSLQPFHREENRLRVRRILESLRSRSAELRLLDVGCGAGFIFELAHDLFAELDGVDITPEMIARMRPYPNAKATIAPVENLPYPPETFDVVTCYSVLHHLHDLPVAFKEIRRVLKPGGVFYADESPAEEYRQAIGKFAEIGLEAVRSEMLKKEICAVLDDVDAYEKLYGIPPEVTRNAMIQNYLEHGLTEENLRLSLKNVGFDDVSIDYRRFIGEDHLRKVHGEKAVEIVRDHLCSLFPLTRPLFKYFVLTAVGQSRC